MHYTPKFNINIHLLQQESIVMNATKTLTSITLCTNTFILFSAQIQLLLRWHTGPLHATLIMPEQTLLHIFLKTYM